MTARKKLQAKLLNPKPPKDSRLTVLWQVENVVMRSGRQFSQYLCQCKCGEKVKVERSKIQSGHKRSCGCLRKEHIKMACRRYWNRRKEQAIHG